MTLSEGIFLENRYRIDELLSQGGMGAIYLGYDNKLDIYVAIKENFFQTEAAIQQFEQEALILARLQHPGLPRVTDHFSFENKQYLVMDYISGKDLWEMYELEGRPFDEEDALKYMIQVCDATSYLHRQNPPIIHRDIKPQNIKITPEGRAVLVDFGIAKVVEADGRTHTGAQAVTPGFSPPEQYGGMGTTPRSDIYALGATLYAILTGQYPPDSISLMAGGAEFEPPEELNAKISPQVSELIEYAMQSQAEDRPQSVADWQRDLEAVLAGRPTSLQTDDGTTRMVKPSATEKAKAGATTRADEGRGGSYPSWIVLGLIGALLVAAVSGLAYFLGRSSGGNEFDAQSILMALGQTATAQAESGAATPAFDLEATLVALAATATAQANQPAAVQAATDTPIPPTPEPTATPTPTESPTPEPTATNSPVPPTFTATPAAVASAAPASKIAFTSTRNGGVNIFVMNNDGSEAVDLTTSPGTEDSYPTWSSDGSQLAFARRNLTEAPTLANTSIQLISADGGEARRLATQAGGPAWSPDGEQIAATGAEQYAVLLNVDSGQGRQLTRDDAFNLNWSPDSSQLAFDDRSNLFLIMRDGSELFQLTFSPADETDPAYSPDGSQLAFVSTTSGNSDIYVMDLSNYQATRITSGAASNIEPAWSPDGSQIAFASNRTGNWDIFVMNADGSEATNLTNHPADDRRPSWSR